MMKQYTPIRDRFESDVPYHKNVNNYFTPYHNSRYCQPFYQVPEASIPRSTPRGGYNSLSPYREAYRDASVGPLSPENSYARKNSNKFVSHDELSYVKKRHGTNLYSPPRPPTTQYGSVTNYRGNNDDGSQSQTQKADATTPDKYPSSSSTNEFSPSLSRARKAGIYPVKIFANTPRSIPYAKYSSYNILADDIRHLEAEIVSPIRARAGEGGSESPPKAGQSKAGISPEKVYPSTPRDNPYAKYSSYHIIADDIRRHQAELSSPRRADYNGGYLPKASETKQGDQQSTPKERSPYALFISHRKLDHDIHKHKVELKSPLRERQAEKKLIDSWKEISGLVSHHAIEISPGRAVRVAT